MARKTLTHENAELRAELAAMRRSNVALVEYIEALAPMVASMDKSIKSFVTQAQYLKKASTH